MRVYCTIHYAYQDRRYAIPNMGTIRITSSGPLDSPHIDLVSHQDKIEHIIRLFSDIKNPLIECGEISIEYNRKMLRIK